MLKKTLLAPVTSRNSKQPKVTIQFYSLRTLTFHIIIFLSLLFLSHLLIISFAFAAGCKRVWVFLCAKVCADQRSDLSGLPGFAEVSCSGFVIRCKMLTDPAEGKGEKAQPQTSWETSLAVYPRLSLLIAITPALSRHRKLAMGKEGFLGNKQHWRTGGWLNMKDNRFRVVVWPKLPMLFLF